MSTEASTPKTASGQFTFQRMGGINQAVLATDYDWQHLDELNPKLWMAMSCPIRGLEFNLPTLEALDLDHNGRIRGQEVKEAAHWVCQCLLHPAILAQSKAEVALSELRDDTEEGKAIANALTLALKKFEKEENSLPLADIENVLAEASGYPFNGDGIVGVDSAEYAVTSNQGLARTVDFIRLALACVGGKKDASGVPGIDEGLADEFIARATAARAWREKVKNAEMPLGEKTGEAWTLLQKLAPKLNDYFYRCQVAAYAPGALESLNEDQFAQNLVAGKEGDLKIQLDNEVLASLPLARVDASGKLDLSKNLNPAWDEDLKTFAALFAAMLPSEKGASIVDAATWRQIYQKFGEYGEALRLKPVYDAPPADAEQIALPGLPVLALAPADDPLGRSFLPLDPNLAVEALSDEQITWITAADTKKNMQALLRLDLEAPQLSSFQDLRKLALFKGYLHTFMRNFLSFMDFYDPEKKAIFQSGTLYLDSRACTLCVPVDDIDAHAALADPSHLCLIYCECVRKEADGAESSGIIAAALTEGFQAGLIDGRHGLFIDNQGKEWDTRIARIIHNPVSLKEAAWSPYVRIGTMISEQIQKFASSRDEDVTKLAGDAAAKAAAAPAPAKPAEPRQGFDFAKGAGIFAAVSMAVGVLSAAFAYIANSVASLGWWWPLALVLVFVCISVPSMFLAWLKLRKRSLGPLLDASGWAVNQGAPINLAMGAALTTSAKLPRNSRLDLNDPYSVPGKMLRRKWRNRFWLCVILIIVLAIAGIMLYCNLFGAPEWLTRLRALAGV